MSNKDINCKAVEALHELKIVCFTNWCIYLSVQLLLQVPNVTYTYMRKKEINQTCGSIHSFEQYCSSLFYV